MGKQTEHGTVCVEARQIPSKHDAHLVDWEGKQAMHGTMSVNALQNVANSCTTLRPLSAGLSLIFSVAIFLYYLVGTTIANFAMSGRRAMSG